MGLAGAGSANQHDVVGPIGELALMQLPDRGLVGLAGGEIEAGQVFVGWKSGRLGVVGNGAHLALGHLGFEQLGQDGDSRLECWCTLFSEFAHCLGHAEHLEAAQHDDQSGAGGIMTHGAPPGPAARRSARCLPSAPGATPGPAAHR